MKWLIEANPESEETYAQEQGGKRGARQRDKRDNARNCKEPWEKKNLKNNKAGQTARYAPGPEPHYFVNDDQRGSGSYFTEQNIFKSWAIYTILSIRGPIGFLYAGAINYP